MWLGLHQAIEGPDAYWKWTDGTTYDYSRWDKTEQIRYLGENAILRVDDAYFHRVNMTDEFPFICKADLGNADVEKYSFIIIYHMTLSIQHVLNKLQVYNSWSLNCIILKPLQM